MSFAYRIEQLTARHDRSAFTSGSPPLDRYIREQATQDMRRLVAKCFVAAPADETRIAGFYTLAAASLPLDLLPLALQRKLPRYPTVPVARIGRLAMDAGHQGKKLGATLLSDALLRAAKVAMSVFALIVDTKDDVAEAFHRHYGFQSFAPRQLFMPVASVSVP